MFIHRIGWMGVDLFFVLSGFLVSGVLFREYQRHQGLQVGRFLARRGFKIYPGFYLLLLATWAMGASAGPRGAITTPQLLREAFYLQSYVPGFWSHTWSLAVEEHFYL